MIRGEGQCLHHVQPYGAVRVQRIQKRKREDKPIRLMKNRDSLENVVAGVTFIKVI